MGAFVKLLPRWRCLEMPFTVLSCGQGKHCYFLCLMGRVRCVSPLFTCRICAKADVSTVVLVLTLLREFLTCFTHKWKVTVPLMLRNRGVWVCYRGHCYYLLFLLLFAHLNRQTMNFVQASDWSTLLEVWRHVIICWSGVPLTTLNSMFLWFDVDIDLFKPVLVRTGFPL